jgi:hypothetical protein
MAWGRRTSPVDRSVRELERQIAALQRQMRTLAADGRDVSARRRAVDERSPAARGAPAIPRVVDAAEPMALAVPPEPDLFTPPAAKEPDKLAHYLGAGSVRSFARRPARATRHRFFLWVGLSLAVLWLIYVVVR